MERYLIQYTNLILEIVEKENIDEAILYANGKNTIENLWYSITLL